jgi:hypothetical protein
MHAFSTATTTTTTTIMVNSMQAAIASLPRTTSPISVRNKWTACGFLLVISITILQISVPLESLGTNLDEKKEVNGGASNHLYGDKEKLNAKNEAGEAPLAALSKEDGNSILPTLNQSSPDELFLDYAVHCGWSNQLICHINAYFIARATGRTLVTAPVLPHFNYFARQMWADMRFQYHGGKRVISSNFNLDFPLEKKYLEFPQLPLGHVVDIPYTFPNVSTIEFQQFREKYYHNGHTNLSHWVMEANYTHGNTKFVFQQPTQHNTIIEGRTRKGGLKMIADNTHGNSIFFFQQPSQEIRKRDISIIAEQGVHHQLWTFLSTFHAKMDPSIGVLRNRFRLRFSQVIRNTAKTIHQDVWNNIQYSSIHLCWRVLLRVCFARIVCLVHLLFLLCSCRSVILFSHTG